MEKTFEELIEELHNKAGRNFSMKEETAELLQQVREATKREIMQLAIKDFGIVSAIIFNNHIKSLPNDRIKPKNQQHGKDI